LGKKTPQGDLNAAAAASGQMLDAHAHGAGNSPEWQPRWDELTTTIARQRAAMKAAGHSTEEADAYLKNEVHRFLKAKGLTDDEVTAQIASAADPLDLVKPHLRGEAKDNGLAQVLTAEAKTLAAMPKLVAESAAPKPAAPLTVDLDAIAGDLKSIGILSDVAENIGHGLESQGRGAAPARGGRVNS
jgi:Spy/CpxP family protein refolding chaperone